MVAIVIIMCVLQLRMWHRSVWKSLHLAGSIATKMRTWNNPQAVVVIQSAVDLVEMVVVVKAPPPALAIEAFDIVSPISVPVRCIAAVARLE